MIVIRNYGFGSNVLGEATALWQAKNYEGAGAWLDEVGTANFQLGSVAGSYIGKTSFGGDNALILPSATNLTNVELDTNTLAPNLLDVYVRVRSDDFSVNNSIRVFVYPDSAFPGTDRQFYARFFNNHPYWLGTRGSADKIKEGSNSVSAILSDPEQWYWVHWQIDASASTWNLLCEYATTDTQDYTSVTGWTTIETSTVAGGGSGIQYSGGAIPVRVSGVNSECKALVVLYDSVIEVDADFEAEEVGTTSFTEDSSNADTVTVNSTEADTNDPLFLPHSTDLNPFGAGVDYVYHPALTTVSQHISVADNAVFDTTGDIDLRVWCRPTSWASGLSQSLINRDNIGTDPNRCWAFTLGTGGTLGFSWYPGGTTASQLGATSTALTTSVFSNGQAGWVRVTLDVDNGSGGYDVKFYTSTDGSNWTQLGTTVTGGSTTNLIASNEPLWLGDRRASGAFIFSFVGEIARAQFYHGIDGTLVADFNPSGGTISSTHSTLTGTGDGLTWTFNRASTGRKLAVVDEDKFLLGTDDYFTTPYVSDIEFGTASNWSVAFVGRSFRFGGDGNVNYGPFKRSGSPNFYGWAVYWDDSTGLIRTVEKDSSGTTVDSSGLNYTLGERTVITGVSNRDSATIISYKNTTAGTTLTSATPRNTSNTVPLTLGLAREEYQDIEIVALAIFKDKALTASEVAQVVSELAP